MFFIGNSIAFISDIHKESSNYIYRIPIAYLISIQISKRFLEWIPLAVYKFVNDLNSFLIKEYKNVINMNNINEYSNDLIMRIELISKRVKMMAKNEKSKELLFQNWVG